MNRIGGWKRRKGFSLIEVVLALGVIAFAIVGIMGLFPVAMRAAQESQRETRATLIARTIFSDLQSPEGHRIATGTNIFNSGSFITHTLSNAWSAQVFYSDEGIPLGTNSTPQAVFLAILTNTPAVPTPGLARVQLDVVTPALAPPANRTTNTFVTLLRQQ